RWIIRKLLQYPNELIPPKGLSAYQAESPFVIINIDYELTEVGLTALIAVRDRSEETLSAGTALAFEKKFAFRSLRTRAFPAGVAPLRSPELVCVLILNAMLAIYVQLNIQF